MWHAASVDVVSVVVDAPSLGRRFGGRGAAVSSVGGRARNGKLQNEHGWRLATAASTAPIERHLTALWSVVEATCPGGVGDDVDGVVLTLTSWSDTADARARAIVDPGWLAWLASSGGWLELEQLGAGPPPTFRYRPDGLI